MISFMIVAMQLLATTPPVGEPWVSADVVAARFERVSLAVWLLWEETQNASRMTARVRVVATDGKRRLPVSMIEAPTR